ncbi:MAG: hypothetical protein MHM6MM_005578 [Cercozoa sp. M6MM]
MRWLLFLALLALLVSTCLAQQEFYEADEESQPQTEEEIRKQRQHDTIREEWCGRGVSCYDVLGVDSSASMKEIKKQFRRLSRDYHPDYNKAEDAQEVFSRMSHAYGIVGDPEMRKRYDAAMRRRDQMKAPIGVFFVGAAVVAVFSALMVQSTRMESHKRGRKILLDDHVIRRYLRKNKIDSEEISNEKLQKIAEECGGKELPQWYASPPSFLSCLRHVLLLPVRLFASTSSEDKVRAQLKYTHENWQHLSVERRHQLLRENGVDVVASSGITEDRTGTSAQGSSKMQKLNRPARGNTAKPKRAKGNSKKKRN